MSAGLQLDLFRNGGQDEVRTARKRQSDAMPPRPVGGNALLGGSSMAASDHALRYPRRASAGSVLCIRGEERDRLLASAPSDNLRGVSIVVEKVERHPHEAYPHTAPGLAARRASGLAMARTPCRQGTETVFKPKEKLYLGIDGRLRLA